VNLGEWHNTKISKIQSLPKNPETCCLNTTVWQLLKQAEAKDADIKLFEMHPDGCSPLHSHLEQHRVIIIDGEGTIFDGKTTHAIRSGDVISIFANEPHQFKIEGKLPFKFLSVTFNSKA